MSAEAVPNLARSGRGGHGVSDATVAADGPPTAPDADVDLTALIEEHSGSAFRVALAVVRDRAMAEDVVQETMVKVWTSYHTFRGEGSVRGWILQIAHNVAVSTLRRVKDVAVDPTVIPERHTRFTTEQKATGRVAMEALEQALAELDPVSRSIVVLRELEGLSYDEIAEALDVPATTVKTRLFRARRQLENALGDWT